VCDRKKLNYPTNGDETQINNVI